MKALIKVPGRAPGLQGVFVPGMVGKLSEEFAELAFEAVVPPAGNAPEGRDVADEEKGDGE